MNNSPTPVIIGSFSSYSTEFSTHFSPTSFLSVPGKPGWLARVIGREGKELHYTVLTAPMSRKNGIERKDVVRRVLNFFFQDCKRKNSRRRSVRVACRFPFALTPLQAGGSRGGQRAAAGAFYVHVPQAFSRSAGIHSWWRQQPCARLACGRGQSALHPAWSWLPADRCGRQGVHRLRWFMGPAHCWACASAGGESGRRGAQPGNKFRCANGQRN